MAKKTLPYQNNPFFVATEGLSLFFKLASPIAIIVLVITVVGFLGSTNQSLGDINSDPIGANHETRSRDLKYKALLFKDHILALNAQEWLVVGSIVVLIVIGVVLVSTIISGVLEYTAAQIARGKAVTLGEALRAVLKRFFPYLWLKILVALKIFLWSLILIVPGIIMAIRYSLAGVSFFDKNISANTATKDSSALVKGAWLTTNASQRLFNIITLGAISNLLQPGTNATLYRQLDDYKKADTPKPPAHILSWLTLLLPIIFIIIAGALLVVIGLNTELGNS